MGKGHAALHTCKGVLASGAMPKDELQLLNVQMKKIRIKEQQEEEVTVKVEKHQ